MAALLGPPVAGLVVDLLGDTALPLVMAAGVMLEQRGYFYTNTALQYLHNTDKLDISILHCNIYINTILHCNININTPLHRDSV